MRILVCLFVSVLVPSIASKTDAQLIVAHRGASYDAPENTLAAFALAWKQGADAVEGDFYVTKDQQIVCIHDKSTKRVAPQQPVLSVAKSTLKQLQQLDVGSWKHKRYAGERIPTLRDVLAIVPDGKQIFVEIKCGPEILPLLQKQLKLSGLKPEQIVIICFNKAVVTRARKLMPNYNANWLTSYRQDAKAREWRPSRNEILTILKDTGATGLGSNGNLKVVDESFSKSIREAGFQLHVWTVNDINTARKFAALGVSSITTDRPKFIRDAVQTQLREER